MEIKCVNLAFQDELVPLEKSKQTDYSPYIRRWMGCV